MNPNTTKTNQKHSPFRRRTELDRSGGAKPTAIGFCGDAQCFIIAILTTLGWPLFSFASILKDGK
jgi:hypothetical protein